MIYPFNHNRTVSNGILNVVGILAYTIHIVNKPAKYVSKKDKLLQKKIRASPPLGEEFKGDRLAKYLIK